MKQKLRNLSIHDRLHLEVSIALSFCIVVVLLTLYLIFGYRGTVDLAPQSETNQGQADQVATTKPQNQDEPKSTDSITTEQDKEPNKSASQVNKESDSKGIIEESSKDSNRENNTENTDKSPKPDKSVSLSFSLEETQKKYSYTFKIENASKLPVGLTLPSKDILKYKISLYDGGIVKSGTIGTVDNTALSIKPKEIYELNIDINNIISGFNEGVYLFEVTPTIPIYDNVKASVMFSITKTQA